MPETRLLIKFKNIEMTISYCYYTKCVLYVILNIQDRMHVLFVCQKVISQAKKCLFNVMWQSIRAFLAALFFVFYGDNTRTVPPVSVSGQKTCDLCSQSCSSWGSRADGRHRCGWSSAWSYNTSGSRSRTQHTCQLGLQRTCRGTRGWRRQRGHQLRWTLETATNNYRALLGREPSSFTPYRWRCAVKWRPVWEPSLTDWYVGNRDGPQTLSSSVDCGHGQSTAGSIEKERQTQ